MSDDERSRNTGGAKTAKKTDQWALNDSFIRLVLAFNSSLDLSVSLIIIKESLSAHWSVFFAERNHNDRRVRSTRPTDFVVRYVAAKPLWKVERSGRDFAEPIYAKSRLVAIDLIGIDE